MEDTKFDFSEDPSIKTYDIFQEAAEGPGKLNRLFFDLKNNKQVAYYCQVTPQQVEIHSGDKNGPIIATADSFLGKDGVTDLQLTDGGVFSVRHKHHTIPLTHGSSSFSAGGKNYIWRKHYDLIEEGTNTVLAVIHPARGSSHLGTLYIFPAGNKIKDLIVLTALVDTERHNVDKSRKVFGFWRFF